MLMMNRNEIKEKVRLQKFLAQQIKIGSRRRAEVFIQQKRIKVNNFIAEIGQKIDPTQDKITLDDVLLRQEKKEQFILAMNKPVGVVCSHTGGYNYTVIFDLLPHELKQKRLFLAGRLDKDSEGLVILTNDGMFAHGLMHPSNEVVKRYTVTLSRPFEPNHRQVLLRGVTVEGERLYADKVIFSNKNKSTKRLEIHLHQGRKREIRRMLQALGYKVEKLCRYQIGHLVLKNLPKGHYRFLISQPQKSLY